MLKRKRNKILSLNERCGLKFFPLCLAFPLFPLIKIDIINLEAEMLKKFKNKNYEYKMGFATYMLSKYWKYLSIGFVIMFIIAIIQLPWTLPELASEFSSPWGSVIWIITGYTACLLFVMSLFPWAIYFIDNIKITHEGIYYKNFSNKEELIQWEEIEDVRETFFKICILILSDKNILKRYIFFYLPAGFPRPIWNKKVEEVCKFIKFKIMENRKIL